MSNKKPKKVQKQSFCSKVWRTVLIFPATYTYERYKDWDNAHMIKGLARDFPELVRQIEEATGLDLETKTDCMTSSEKYTSGVKTCELAYGLQTKDEALITKAFSVVENNENFVKSIQYENKEGYYFKYQRKQSCSFASTESVYGSCIIGVREKNIELVKQVLK